MESIPLETLQSFLMPLPNQCSSGDPLYMRLLSLFLLSSLCHAGASVVVCGLSCSGWQEPAPGQNLTHIPCIAGSSNHWDHRKLSLFLTVIQLKTYNMYAFQSSTSFAHQ